MLHDFLAKHYEEVIDNNCLGNKAKAASKYKNGLREKANLHYTKGTGNGRKAMRQCLSCNQPCSSFSAFCDACRESLLNRDNDHDEAMPEKQPKWARVKSDKRVVDLSVETLREREQAVPHVQTKEEFAWSSEDTEVYQIEDKESMDEGERMGRTEVVQITLIFTVPLPQQNRMPGNVRWALLIFCITGVLALITDTIMLALSCKH